MIDAPSLEEQFIADSHIESLKSDWNFSDSSDWTYDNYDFPAACFRYRVVKRSIDLLFILLLLPIFVPVMIVVAILVKLSTSGPIFFSQPRVCGETEYFRIVKFRTMSVNADQILKEHFANSLAARIEWHDTHKLRSDPRVNAIGSFLRRYSLDELPQIWNVFKGDMSIIGPRPIIRAEIVKYGSRFPYYCRVKPGLSGLWQVSGRNATTYPQRVSLDCEYVRRWSLRLDFKIMLRSVSTVLSRHGAF